MSSSADRRRVRQAALRVGLLVGAASAVVIAAGVGILVAVILLTARPDGRHEGGFGHPDGDRFVVDVDHVLPWVIALGVLGVVLLGCIAWIAAARSVRPLESALTAQRTFVSDAGHELRTPLTALTSRIQIAQRRLARGEPVAETLDELRRDAGTLDDVLTDMLLTADGRTDATQRADVAACLTAAADTLRAVAEAHEVSLTVDAADDISARVPATTLTRMCVALLDNAIGHAPAGTAVAAAAVRAGAIVEIRIIDAGPGISDADAARVFERFARGAESGRRRGFGLGLALVRQAADRYGGDIRIERTSPAGTTFLLTLAAG